MKIARPYKLIAVLFFLAVIALQLTLLARANSATWDEADHTYAAYMQYRGDFGLNPEHPPLVKFLAALPLQDLRLKLPPMLDRSYRLQEVIGGREFVFGNDANQILFRARMATMSLTLLLAVCVFVAAQEMFGDGAAILALALLCFDPTLLAHSALVTTDSAQALFLFATIYAFYRYNRRPTLLRLAGVGVMAGLALASKHSAVLLLPMLAVLGVAEAVLQRMRARAIVCLGSSLAVAGAVAVAILWAFYGFRFAARPVGLVLHPDFQTQLLRVPGGFEAHVLAFADRFHLLPESYLYGFAHVLFESKAFHSYLLGTIYPHPVWFYFPVAILIKSTLTYLILLAVSLWMLVSGQLRRTRETIYLLVPAAIYMLFAMAGGMNIGVRHILPIYILTAVWIAGAVEPLFAQNRQWLYAVGALLMLQAVSVLHAYPAYVSYANEAFGGPAEVHQYLSDSSSDWGQQMKSVSRYLDEHKVTQCWFAYFGEGVAEFSYYGIPCKPLITADSLYFDVPHDVPREVDGPVLMSAGVLSGFEFGPGTLNPYAAFKTMKPAATIDYGVFVFNGHFNLSLASALSLDQKAGLLLKSDPAAALADAQAALMLAPGSASVNQMVGEALDACGRREDALPFYRRSLALARSIEPAFEAGLIADLAGRIGQNR